MAANASGSPEGSKRSYHHGSLRESLVEAGLQLARPAGPSGVGLRAASRLAGVSHNAAYRHFADHDALLNAVGERCMQELATQMQARLRRVRSRDPVSRAWARLYAIGETYVEFAITETGWFRTAFGAHEDKQGPPAEVDGDATTPGPFDLLSVTLDELVDAGAVRVEGRPGLEYAAWSAVHGLSMLLVDGPLRELPSDERAFALRTVLDVVAAGLPRRPE